MNTSLYQKPLVKFTAFIIIFTWVAGASAQTPTRSRRSTRATRSAAAANTTPEAAQIPDTERLAQLEALLAQPPAARLEGLRAFVAATPADETREDSPLRTRAVEQLVSTLAAVGDEYLTNGETEAGIKHFREAVAAAPAKMSEKLFIQIVSQLPSNLFLRGEQKAAFDIARRIETKIISEPQSLLALATFYLSVEQADEAARLIELSLRYAETATARIALGAARRLNLQLDASITEYKRALELDSTSATARRALADLYRAVGKPAEAITLYQAQLALTPDDAVSRAGFVLSLFDLNRRQDAERELKIALEKSPEDLALLTGAAYWYAAQTEAETARAYAGRAVVREPRYTWAHIANARALIMLKRPLEAERSLRLAAQFGDFPTLSYELANALASSGFYEEAATELARTFRITPDGEISARLANRIEASNESFIELLAPERRASIYQPTAADTIIHARRLAALLAFHTALAPETSAASTTTTSRKRGAPKRDSKELSAEAREKILLDSADTLASGNDELRFYRQLYVIERLVKRTSGVSPAVRDRIIAIAEAATATVEVALDAPTATEAAFADELRKTRLDAIAVGTTPQLPRVPRQVISAVVRGRLEDARGRALVYSGKAEEGLPYLRRAATVLPEGTVWSRANAWHIGTALEALGDNSEALAAYIKSYRATPITDPVRRAVITNLYRRLNNNSVKGLDEFINAQGVRSVSSSTNR